MTAFDNLRDAVVRARASRSNLLLRTDGTIKRLAPERLADDALGAAQTVLREGAAESRRHPLLAAGVVAGAIGWLFRRPLSRYGASWLGSRNENYAETKEPDTPDSRSTGNVADDPFRESETIAHD